MSVFQHILWGYHLTYPNEWVHRSMPETEGFAASDEAFEIGAQGPGSGHLLIRSDWNGARKSVEQLWTHHIGQTAGMLLAKKVGAAPWHMAGGVGYEAEIVLPKRENQRLWVGMLSYGFILMQLMVVHPIEDRQWFEPVITEIIKSLKFPRKIEGITENDAGIPVPPEYRAIDPATIIPDIRSGQWEGYEGESGAGCLQAFYVREMLARGWLLEELTPYPGPSDLGFARLRFNRQEDSITIGILPKDSDKQAAANPARVVMRYH